MVFLGQSAGEPLKQLRSVWERVTGHRDGRTLARLEGRERRQSRFVP
jgi:hypothetical protein